jgi:hypothetical protein
VDGSVGGPAVTDLIISTIAAGEEFVAADGDVIDDEFVAVAVGAIDRLLTW